MTEQQRQTNNMLLQMIQRHFPSLPLSDEYTDWPKWLAFANAAYKAGADAERNACEKLCWEQASTPCDSTNQTLYNMGVSKCAKAIQERSNAEFSGGGILPSAGTIC